MSNDVQSMTIHEEAVRHARAAMKSGDLSWKHVRSEFTQDVPTVLATLQTGGPYTWTLPNNGFIPGDDALQYFSATTFEQIQATYENMRNYVQVWDWVATTEIRAGWYTITHGVSRLRDVLKDEYLELESITMFPTGTDGILGEVQIGDLGVARENRWPEVPAQPGEVPLPRKRLEVLKLHNTLLDGIREADVDKILSTMRADVATAIRSYLGDDYTVLNAKGPDELADYYRSLFERFKIVNIDIVNRIAESWFLFAEVHWTVEHRTGAHAGEVVEFCTADLAPIDPDGKFWVRTGAGTDPLPAVDPT
jgi:hypothetical protein